MSIQPFVPSHLLTVGEYLELGETETGYTELVEGRLLLNPSPLGDHNRAAFVLGMQLTHQLPAGLEVLPDVDIDLELAPADRPGTVRRPDLIVVSTDARLRQRRDGGVIRARDVVIAIEVLSPGSARVDNVAKRAEYADAGIPHYWIIDVTAPVTLLACRRTDEFGYVDENGAVTGVATVTAPFPLQIDLARLI